MNMEINPSEYKVLIVDDVISNSGLSEDDMERYRILLQTRTYS